MPGALLMWLATMFLFVISILGGFSIGRYSSFLPLLLTAFVVSKELNTSLRALALGIALLIWWLFSFLLFGRVHLFTGLLIEGGLSSVAFLVWALLIRQHSS